MRRVRLAVMAAASVLGFAGLSGVAVAGPPTGVAADPPPSPLPSDAPSAAPTQPAPIEEVTPPPGAARREPVRTAPPGALFHSSLESADPQPAWLNTVEEGRKAEGITGSTTGGIPGNITDEIVDIAASGEYTAAGEVKENLLDGDVNTKWLVFSSTGWVSVKLSKPIAVARYAMASANDAAERDPRDWALEGSSDGEAWTAVDTRAGEVFDARLKTREFDVASPQSFLYYRLNVTKIGSGSIVQLAELQLSDGDTSPKPPTDMRTLIGPGPGSGYTAKPRAGYTGLKALRYSGSTTTATGGHSTNKVFETDIPVTADTELSYLLFPEFTGASLSYPSTYVSVDLAFSDGTYLSDLKAKDQHGIRLSPRAQGESKTLYADQWNLKRSRVGEVAKGKRIKRVLVAYDGPAGPLPFKGWVDDITLTNAKPQQVKSLADHVVTTRGTQSTGGFSRGNNFPATAVPHGFNFWTPMTGSGSNSWLYEYHRNGNADNIPTIQAFAAGHEPSPWMGDRQSFQVMPSLLAKPDPDRVARATQFLHSGETAKPYYYGVDLLNGIRTEIAPADHAAIFRFTFPGEGGSLIFDNYDNNGGLSIDQGVVTGYTDARSGLSAGATRMYVYAVFDQRPDDGGKLTGAGRDNVTGYAHFAAKQVTMRIATSFIGVEQARHNLELENGTFEEVRARAQRAWEDRLDAVEVEGATQDQLTTLYSNLYRLFLYPNSGFENTGTAAAPAYRYASPVSARTGPDTPTRTGAKIVDGKIYVNNGFWDTYRTTWPAYSLLSRDAGELVDGFVQQYRDGGWIARWSSPGYADLMVGTSSDVAFADAYSKGVRGFDAKSAYAAAVKNATVVPPNSAVGRKGLQTSIFRGYTALNEVGEGLSWAMDGYINDYGISTMAAALAKQATGAEKTRYLEESEYFRNRALNYVNMFDPEVGFFQGRDSTGKWRRTKADYDPRVWGFDYTETNGWNMAFHAPQDGAGLASLYGGRQGLAKKLDAFFADQETATFGGSYNGVIHEMREARDVRMGQYGHSNQPSHHIIYMYDYVGQAAKTQAKVREALSRLYLGSEIGQGYPGDEDNGEMSAWYVFGALGFYPLQAGSQEYAIGSPLFRKATVHLPNGRDVVVKAPDNSARNVYVQGLKVNGKAWRSTSLPHDVLARGAVLDFSMGSKPSSWGEPPESITPEGQAPRPLRDIAVSGGPAELSDDTSATSTALAGNIALKAGSRDKVTFYTLTSAATGAPASWKLEGSYDGAAWTVIDQRDGQAFEARQTRPFKIGRPGRYAHYRLTATGTLAELELLAAPAPTCTRTISGTHNGSLTVSSGVTCLAAGAHVTGSVVVRGGASLAGLSATVDGAVAATGAEQVTLADTTVGGPLAATSVKELSLERSSFGGPVALVGNTGPVIAASTVKGPLTCAGNTPAPVGNGLPNTVSGPALGQCKGL
ncbi:GH92 family glycosyl hydrolase [Nonomuraea rhizosphaerae]|uniref:GH92 family glycosyl hydrolase n=1 Tax=Nonomuraea rhizosphaerae TaxID=2665663 RepID=UPI001C5F7EA7|nr:GH92 family glycosyl hydrolase [Nonomuraea rhizosphaerae]